MLCALFFILALMMPLDLPGRVVSLRRNFSESVKCATQYHSLSVPNCMFILNLPDPLPNCYAGLISLVCDSLAYPDPLPGEGRKGSGNIQYNDLFSSTPKRVLNYHIPTLVVANDVTATARWRVSYSCWYVYCLPGVLIDLL